MKERTFQNGEVIYHEGDASDAVHLIHGGAVEVFKQTVDEILLLARLERGQVLGETGVIRGVRRSTSARASGVTVLLSLEAEEFITAIGGREGIGIKVMRMLCERLAGADRKLTQLEAEAPEARRGGFKRISVLPDSPLVERQIGAGFTIRNLPFRVGQQAPGAAEPGVRQEGLVLAPSRDLHLAADHFTIEFADDGVLVARDQKTRLGAVVNGRRIAVFENRLTAPLKHGPNKIIAGGEDSPYRFIVLVE